MTEKNLKRECATAAFAYVPAEGVIGLGGGTTIHYLIDLIAKSHRPALQVVTPSAATRSYCKQSGLNLGALEDISRIDRAFDGCDQVDTHFNALKSGGAIHTKEKLIAAMADDYMLLVDESKYTDTLTFALPVAIEVLPPAFSYVSRRLAEFGATAVVPRTSAAKDGITVSDGGNLIVDAFFPESADVRALNRSFFCTPGIVDTSLFVDVVSAVLVTGESGSRLVRKSSEKIDKDESLDDG
ncbi:MAG: ribose 5-phosphate isomerase A [Sporolactobacillus sp.]